MPNGPACAGCGQENPPRARFCMHCGALIESTPPQTGTDPSGERRQLTVMFCDLVDSTAISQRLDAEEYSDLILSAQKVIRAAVDRYEGHIAQFLGDGVLVYFGYPQAYEDSAQRALLAALDLLDAFSATPLTQALVPEEVAFRIGIHTGDVVIESSGPEGDSLAMGDTTNIAARIEGEAAPNGIAISEPTFRLLRGGIRVQSLGQPILKGVNQGLTVYRVLGREQVAEPSRQVRSPMVGRDVEHECLSRHLEDALDGRGIVVRVFAEPGLGKSRLVENLRPEAEAADMRWLHLACSPHTSHTPLAPVSDWFSRYLGIRDQREVSDSALDDARRMIVSLALEDPDSVALFARLIGVDRDDDGLTGESAERLRLRTRRAITDLLRSLSHSQPTVLVVEDLHWCDPTTLEWLNELVTACRHWPILVILTHRPEFSPPWPNDQEQPAIKLSALTSSETRALVESLAQQALAPLVDQIVSRADGVPLFIEELTRMLHESGFDPEQPALVPMTLKDSLMARLDRLGTAKRLAQTAAALGREFHEDLLARCAGTAPIAEDLHRLVQADLVYTDRNAIAGTYVFKHALVQEVAYETVLRRDRRELHSRIARVLADDFPDLVDHRPEEHGRHLAAAGDNRAAGEAYDRAGRKAALRAAFHEASNHYRTAARLVAAEESNADFELGVQIQLGNALMASHGYASEDTVPVWQRAAELAQSTNNALELSSALNGSAVYALLQGDVRGAAELAGRILSIANEAGSSETARIAALRGNCTLAQQEFYIGNPEAALRYADQALDNYRPDDFHTVTYGIGTDHAVIAYCFSAFAHHWAGRYGRSFADAEASVAFAEDLGSPISIAMARTIEALVQGLAGNQQTSLTIASRLADEADELGFAYYRGFGLTLRAMARLRMDGTDRGALEELGTGLDALGVSGGQGGAAMVLGFLGEAYWLTGDAATATAFLDGGLGSAAETGQHYYDSEILKLKGDVARAGDPNVAMDFYQNAASDARDRGAHGMAIRAIVPLAELMLEDDRGHQVEALLERGLATLEPGVSTETTRVAERMLASLKT